jgi:hypothetical protein
MIMKNKLVICSVLMIILTAGMVISGCTSSPAQTSPQSNSPTISPTTATPSPALSSATVPETRITTPVQTTALAATTLVTGTPANDVLTVTLNSAEKKISLGNSIGNPGRVLLLLDITIKNNDKKNDFTYTDSSFVISYKSNNKRLTAITSQYVKNLANPLFMGTVPAGSTDDGKILFGVNSTSDTYTLSVVDSAGTVLGSIDTIYVP